MCFLHDNTAERQHWLIIVTILQSCFSHFNHFNRRFYLRHLTSDCEFCICPKKTVDLTNLWFLRVCASVQFYYKIQCVAVVLYCLKPTPKTAEELKRQQERDAEERTKTIASRVPQLSIDGLDKGELIAHCSFLSICHCFLFKTKHNIFRLTDMAFQLQPFTWNNVSQ